MEQIGIPIDIEQSTTKGDIQFTLLCIDNTYFTKVEHVYWTTLKEKVPLYSMGTKIEIDSRPHASVCATIKDNPALSSYLQDKKDNNVPVEVAVVTKDSEGNYQERLQGQFPMIKEQDCMFQFSN